MRCGPAVVDVAAGLGAWFHAGGFVHRDRKPDARLGSTPIAFGNWKQAYTVVDSKAVTMLDDP
jgi:hypothetical protein